MSKQLPLQPLLSPVLQYTPTTINSTFAFPSGDPHAFHANSSKQRHNLSAWNDRLQLTLSRREPLVTVIQLVNHSQTSDGSSLTARLIVAALVISQKHPMCNIQTAVWADSVGC
ncbi:unnamed protein product [Boreogadus saida]